MDGVGPEHMTEEQRTTMDNTGLAVVRQGMRVVELPVGTEQIKLDFLQEAVNGGPAELVRALVPMEVLPMEGAQASYQILRLSAASRLSYLLCSVPPAIICQAAADYDALVEWALASIIAGDEAAAAGLPTPEEVAHDPTVRQNQTYLGHEALRQAHLPIRERGPHRLPRRGPGTFRRASARGNLPSLLNGYLSDPWRQRSLKSLRPWPPKSR